MLKGWRERVAADPEFPFKVLIEQARVSHAHCRLADDCRQSILALNWLQRLPMPPADSVQVIGVGAAVVGDMSTRKDWGIHELDFVFSTIVVCQSGLSAFARHWPCWRRGIAFRHGCSCETHT